VDCTKSDPIVKKKAKKKLRNLCADDRNVPVSRRLADGVKDHDMYEILLLGSPPCE
jgi:hypothetical protein